MRKHFRYKFAGAVCAAFAVLITPALLLAHARLLRSAPAVNSVVTPSVRNLSLWFSEKPELRFTMIELVDSAGTVIPLGATASIDSMGVTAPIATPLAAGRYSVAWRTAASDGHATSGRFAFAVAPDSVSAAAVARDTTPKKTAPVGNAVIEHGESTGYSTAVRWAELVAAITLIGGVVFRLFVLPRTEWPENAVSSGADRTRRLAGAVLVLFLIAAVMRLSAQLEMMPKSHLSGPNAGGVSMLLSMAWGRGWLFGFVGALVVGFGLVVSRAATVGWIVSGLGVVAICVGEALTGHAGSLARYTALGVATDVAHFLGAGGWIGGLTCVVMCGLPALQTVDEHTRDLSGAGLTRAYHRVAMECVLLVIASALIAAWLRLGALSDLWTTEYGSWLFRKIIFVLVALGLGAYHWRSAVVADWTTSTARRFRWTAVVELVVGAIIIALTALLVSTALPNSH